LPGMKLTTAQLAKQIGAELVGDSSVQITRVAPVAAAGGDAITFAADRRYASRLEQSSAGAVLVAEHLKDLAKPQLVVKNVNTALIDVLNIFAPPLKPPVAGIDPAAQVAAGAQVAASASVGACAVVEDGARIGENTVIASGCRIGQNSQVGKNSRLDCNVVVYHNCLIGNNVIIQANSTIGSSGFGYVFGDGAHRLIPHIGGVIIEDFVEIGANCCIDRAKFGNTVVGAGTKIDNLVQVAHNVVIGKCCLIVAQVGIAGSCEIGSGVVMAGQAGLADNIKIGNGVMIAAQSGVINDAKDGEKICGSPAVSLQEFGRAVVLIKRLPKFAEQLKRLIARMEKIEAAKDDKKGM